MTQTVFYVFLLGAKNNTRWIDELDEEKQKIKTKRKMCFTESLHPTVDPLLPS